MVKQRFAVLGLGHFGAYVVRTLYEAGKEVIAIDLDQEAVRDAAEYASEAVVADATDRETLESLGVREVDSAIISLGQRLDVITLAALHVKEMGVPYIAVKAVSEEHGRILQILGVNEVIHPEKDSATRLATRLSRTGMVDILPLLSGYSIAEIDAPPEFVGKSLAELALRNNLRVQLIAIQNRKGEDRRINIVPRAEDVIQEGDLLILLGEDKDLDRVREIVKAPPKRIKV
ncbi:MAG: potassium channel family protein [Bryobacteraceae bacterium]